MFVPELEAQFPMNCQPVLVHVATPPGPLRAPMPGGSGACAGQGAWGSTNWLQAHLPVEMLVGVQVSQGRGFGENHPVVLKVHPGDRTLDL